MCKFKQGRYIESEERKIELIHVIYPSPNETLNKKLVPALREIEECGGKVIVINESVLLEGLVQLPFIDTPDGASFFGTKGINNYVERCKAIKNIFFYC